MTCINDIELIIRDLITINETIVATFDSKLLYSDWENTINSLKELCGEKKELIESLEK